MDAFLAKAVEPSEVSDICTQLEKAKNEWILKAEKDGADTPFQFDTNIYFAKVKQDKTLKENWGTIMATAVECCYNGLTGVVGGAGYVLSTKSTAAASKVKLLGYASGTATIGLSVAGPYAAGHVDYIITVINCHCDQGCTLQGYSHLLSGFAIYSFFLGRVLTHHPAFQGF